LTVTSTETAAFDRREQRVLGHLRPAIAEALRRNKPVAVAHLETSLTTKELIALATRVCRHDGANVAVVTSAAHRGVIFVPV
jgi:hypothetical protein